MIKVRRLSSVVGCFNLVVQYYGVAATTVLFYEYFLMLPDEVRRRLSVTPYDCRC